MTTAASLALAAFNFTRGIVPSLIVVRAGVAARSSVFLLGGATDGRRLQAHGFFVVATAARVLSSVRLCCRPKRKSALERCFVCGITFELSGRRRQDARPAMQKMYTVPASRAWWHAVGAPLERGVRHQFSRLAGQCVFACAGLCFPLRATARAVAVLRVCGACQGLCMALCALQRRPQL